MNAWALWTSTEVPVLPGAVVAGVYLHLGWSVVLAWLGRRWGGWAAALVLAAWAWMPGVWGAGHWLGLAFQSPSALAVVWCAYALWGQRTGASPAQPVPTFALVWSLALGWVLLADLMAWLPVSVYAWGFAPAALGLLAVLALAPLAVPVLRTSPGAGQHSAWMLWPLAVLVFVALRLPSGNAWDAVLDPWVWLAAHGATYRRLRAWRAGRRVG